MGWNVGNLGLSRAIRSNRDCHVDSGRWWTDFWLATVTWLFVSVSRIGSDSGRNNRDVGGGAERGCQRRRIIGSSVVGCHGSRAGYEFGDG